MKSTFIINIPSAWDRARAAEMTKEKGGVVSVAAHLMAPKDIETPWDIGNLLNPYLDNPHGAIFMWRGPAGILLYEAWGFQRSKIWRGREAFNAEITQLPFESYELSAAFNKWKKGA